jgi:hypothetical protein
MVVALAAGSVGGSAGGALREDPAPAVAAPDPLELETAPADGAPE